MAKSASRAGWATRFGLIMAVAGNAVGLGNFLRFPGKAAAYGGAFMIPYLLALLLLGIPLMWMEWTIGRHGGHYGHGSTPGQFHRMWRHPISKYLGILGILAPAIVGLYYVYIESWTLGYAWQTLTGAYWGQTSKQAMADTFSNYLGLNGGTLSFTTQAYVFFVITFALNMWIMAQDISKGIELVAKIAMPAMLVIGLVLAIRVLTLPAVDGRTVSDGLAQIWRVDDWSCLKKSDVWISATGQTFFTLSVGFGMVQSYASYLKKEHDLTLNGLTAATTNELFEVVLGGTIAIPAAVVFFGVAEAQAIAKEGTFAIGFHALPLVFQKMFGGQLFGTAWFILLFLAGLTSSMAMFTPLILFLEDELRITRQKAVMGIVVVAFLFSQPIVLFMQHGVLDEIDYWVGDFGLILFGAFEAVVFAWIFGMKKGWEEMHHGADLQVPRIFYYIMKYVTPVYVCGLVGWYLVNGFWGKVLMRGVPAADLPYRWLARGMILSFLAFLVWGVWHAWRTHPKFADETGSAEELK